MPLQSTSPLGGSGEDGRERVAVREDVRGAVDLLEPPSNNASRRPFRWDEDVSRRVVFLLLLWPPPASAWNSPGRVREVSICFPITCWTFSASEPSLSAMASSLPFSGAVSFSGVNAEVIVTISNTAGRAISVEMTRNLRFTRSMRPSLAIGGRVFIHGVYRPPHLFLLNEI